MGIYDSGDIKLIDIRCTSCGYEGQMMELSVQADKIACPSCGRTIEPQGDQGRRACADGL